MCLPIKDRSIDGSVVQQIYDHLHKTRFCRYAFDKNFVRFMLAHDGTLRASGDSLEIMRIVEDYVGNWEKSWHSKFARYVLADFHQFLMKIGVLSSVNREERFSNALLFLYYYFGTAALDEAHRTGKI
jgi:hypothetical protein